MTDLAERLADFKEKRLGSLFSAEPAEYTEEMRRNKLELDILLYDCGFRTAEYQYQVWPRYIHRLSRSFPSQRNFSYRCRNGESGDIEVLLPRNLREELAENPDHKLKYLYLRLGSASGQQKCLMNYAAALDAAEKGAFAACLDHMVKETPFRISHFRTFLGFFFGGLSGIIFVDHFRRLPHDPSFPSGTTQAAIAVGIPLLCGAIGYLCDRHSKNKSDAEITFLKKNHESAVENFHKIYLSKLSFDQDALEEALRVIPNASS